MPEAKRTEITAIKVDLKHPDGTTETVSIDPKSNQALFWSDNAISKLLQKYCDQINVKTTGKSLQAENNLRNLNMIIDPPKTMDTQISIDTMFVSELWQLGINKNLDDSTPINKVVLRPFLTLTTDDRPNSTPFAKV